MLLSGCGIQSRIFDSRWLKDEKCRHAENDEGCGCESARVRRTLRASGEQRCRRAANSAVPGREAGSNASIDSSSDLRRERNMRCFELFDGKHIRLLCAVNFLHAMACKWRFPCKREPERFAQRVDVGAHVERRMFKLLRAGECRRTHESVMGQRFRIGFSVNCFSQTEVDYFHQQLFVVADVRPFRHRARRASDLPVLNRGGLTRAFLRRRAPR